MTTCHVTINNRPLVHHPGKRGAPEHAKCGLPAVKYGLCAKHYARRVALGGKP